MTASVRRSLVFADDFFDELRPLARAAESAGFDRLWTTEWATRDATIRAQMVASATERIRVGTGIAYAFTRPPVAAAALAADVYVASEGRFAMGLGVGTRGVRQRYYGQSFEHPAARFEEYVRLMRLSLSAASGLRFAGRFFEVDAPAFTLGHDPDRLAGLEICGAGVNEAMLTAAARVCDGILLHPITRLEPHFSERVLPAVARGAAGAEREPWIAMWCLTSIDEDEDLARDRGRRSLAFYFSTPTYGTVVAGSRWEGTAAAIRDAFRAGAAEPDWSALEALVPDDMLDELVLAGTPRGVGARLAEVETVMADAGVQELVLQPAALGCDRGTAARPYAAVIAAASKRGGAVPARGHL